jgi:hypothetical protein
MGFLRRVLIVGVGLLCAATLAFILLPVAIIVDPQIGGGKPDWLVAGIVAGILQMGDPERLTASFLFVWTAMMTVCALPLVITGLTGEVARVRSWLWYAAGTGLVSAALPPAIRMGLGSSALRRETDAATQVLEHRLLLLVFLTGVVSGTLYWLIAGRTAGDRGDIRSRSVP